MTVICPFESSDKIKHLHIGSRYLALVIDFTPTDKNLVKGFTTIPDFSGNEQTHIYDKFARDTKSA